MDTQPLLTISAFARAVDLAPSTLRYYDECGLLPPAEVDVRTGYRYYTPNLARRAHLVRRMREMGVPIETMRLVLDDPPEHAARMLQEYVNRAAESARQAAAAMADVLSALHCEALAADNAAPPVAVSVDGPQLGVALERVALGAEAEPDSPLGVVLLDLHGSVLTAVATNRYWLVTWTLPVETRNQTRRVAVPVRGIEDLVAWLARTDVVTMSMPGGAGPSLTFESGDEERSVTTVEDRFPAYRMVLEAQAAATGRVTVDRERLRHAIARARGPVRLAVGRDRVSVSAHHDSEGRHLEAVTVGAPITLDFSADLLGSALSSVVGSEVSLEYVAANRAVRVSSAEQRSIAALVMPMDRDEPPNR